MPSPLSDKQIRFCKEYLVDFNATQAAIRSGYSKKSAKVTGSRMLTNANVQGFLNTQSKKVNTKLEISAERTRLELARVGYQDARQFYNEDGSLKRIVDLDDDAAACIAGMDVEEINAYVDDLKIPIGVLKKIKRYDKVKALELLGKIDGIFEKDNKQKDALIVPLSDNQVDKIISSLRENKTA